VEIIERAGSWTEPGSAGAGYVEHLVVPDLSVGTYSLRAGAADPQKPHGEDEVYVITTGSGQFTSGGRSVSVAAGTVLYVPAHELHRFHDVTEDLTVLVFFGPAEGSIAAG
jgi:mannose-6-phosphate isomerase-like protein (cupin superfamily)